MFSRKDATRQAYEARIDALFSGAKPKQPGVKMLDEADTLTITGYGNLPVTLAEKHAVVDGSKTHPLTVEQWKQIPDWIDNPAAMFERLRDGHITLIGPQKIGGKAVVIALKPEGMATGGRNKMNAHLTLTAYAKDTGTMPLRAMIERGDMKPLYIDQKKASEFYAGSGVQFPGSGFELRGFNKTLKTERDLVKYRAERDRADTADAPRFSRKAGDAQQQFKDTERAYGGRAAYEQAKAAGKTKLTYGQWVQVRTPNFKQWFGDWEAVRELQVKDEASRETAEDALKSIAGKPLTNIETGITAYVNRDQRDKMLSPAARKKSEANGFTAGQHYAIAERLQNLWRHAILVSESGDAKHGDANMRIKRFAAPIVVNGRTRYVTLLAKETISNADGSRIYTLEAHEEKTLRGTLGNLVAGTGDATSPSRSVDEILSALDAKISGEGVSKVIDPQTGEPMVQYHSTNDSGYFKNAQGQTQSATGNSGEFDTDNPDIRFSRKASLNTPRDTPPNVQPHIDRRTVCLHRKGWESPSHRQGYGRFWGRRFGSPAYLPGCIRRICDFYLYRKHYGHHRAMRGRADLDPQR